MGIENMGLERTASWLVNKMSGTIVTAQYCQKTNSNVDLLQSPISHRSLVQNLLAFHILFQYVGDYSQGM